DVRKDAELVVSVYYRAREATAEDVLVGSARVKLEFGNSKSDDCWYDLTMSGRGGDAGGVPHPSTRASVRVLLAFERGATASVEAKKPRGLAIDDFELLKVLGRGTFGKVLQVRKRDTGRVYAMKIVKKAHLLTRDEARQALAERNVLASLAAGARNPFVVGIEFSFQSAEKLYFVLKFMNGGELFKHLQDVGRFDEDRARLYAAELLSAIECLHASNVVYRDLKPENILLDHEGHVALCDFGLCKQLNPDGDAGDDDSAAGDGTTATFCGTPEYIAPELLAGRPYGKQVDWWTLGVLLFEMLAGLPPFYDEDVQEMYAKIASAPLVFPDCVRAEARDLLEK
ncbi:hypothetical protein HK405_000082, partial [Cladochytrium tenue]